jgi:hypothetical protein
MFCRTVSIHRVIQLNAVVLVQPIDNSPERSIKRRTPSHTTRRLEKPATVPLHRIAMGRIQRDPTRLARQDIHVLLCVPCSPCRVAVLDMPCCDLRVDRQEEYRRPSWLRCPSTGMGK